MKHSSYKKEIDIDKREKGKKDEKRGKREKAPFSHGK